MAEIRRVIMSRYALPVAGWLLLLAVTGLYVAAPRLYHVLMLVMEKQPAPMPFADWLWIPAAIRCWGEGVDVYVKNTCFPVPVDYSFNYSPAWLRLTFLAPLEPWTNAVGLGLAAAFFASLSLLPRTGTIWGQVVMLVAMTSTASFLGIERGNVDLIMFLLVIVGAALLRRSQSVRLVAYGLFTCAGLLKFYPFMAFVLGLRERPLLFWLLAVLNMSILAVFVLTFRDELAVMAKTLPAPSWFTLQFSAANLPNGLGQTATRAFADGWGDDRLADLGRIVTRTVSLGLIILTVVGAVWIARRFDLPGLVAGLRGREFLAAGCVVIVGCFFAGPNVLYRGIFLLLTIPGLVDLSRLALERRARWLFAATCWIMLLPLWTPVLEALLFVAGLARQLRYQDLGARGYPDTPVNFVLWSASELAWWWIAMVLVAILGSFVVRTQMWLVARGLVTRAPG